MGTGAGAFAAACDEVGAAWGGGAAAGVPAGAAPVLGAAGAVRAAATGARPVSRRSKWTSRRGFLREFFEREIEMMLGPASLQRDLGDDRRGKSGVSTLASRYWPLRAGTSGKEFPSSCRRRSPW